MSEDRLIAKLVNAQQDSEAEHVENNNFREHITIPIGDDAAGFRVSPNHDLIASVDDLCEGSHFQYDWGSLTQIATKCVGAALSDLAAMGAKPLGAMLALQFDSRFSEAELSEVLEACRTQLNAYQCPLIGGNLARIPKGLNLSLSVFGETPRQHAFRRDQAKIGQEIWLSAGLGRSSLILKQLLEGRRTQNFDEELQRFFDQYMAPKPRFDIVNLIRTSEALANSDHSLHFPGKHSDHSGNSDRDDRDVLDSDHFDHSDHSGSTLRQASDHSGARHSDHSEHSRNKNSDHSGKEDSSRENTEHSDHSATLIRKHSDHPPASRSDIEKALTSDIVSDPVAAIDVSDGLLLDLTRLLKASGVSARIDSRKAACEVARDYAQAHDLDFEPLSSGEEYQLVFCLSPSRLALPISGAHGSQRSVLGRSEVEPLGSSDVTDEESLGANQETEPTQSLRSALEAIGARQIGLIVDPHLPGHKSGLVIDENDTVLDSRGHDHLR